MWCKRWKGVAWLCCEGGRWSGRQSGWGGEDKEELVLVSGLLDIVSIVLVLDATACFVVVSVHRLMSILL
jgi:hypothetical protein